MRLFAYLCPCIQFAPGTTKSFFPWQRQTLLVTPSFIFFKGEHIGRSCTRLAHRLRSCLQRGGESGEQARSDRDQSVNLRGDRTCKADKQVVFVDGPLVDVSLVSIFFPKCGSTASSLVPEIECTTLYVGLAHSIANFDIGQESVNMPASRTRIREQSARGEDMGIPSTPCRDGNRIHARRGIATACLTHLRESPSNNGEQPRLY